jgi:mRNA-degrading endonuclease RelE of RelBE toxin-antitoxin system
VRKDKNKEVYRIVDRETGEEKGAYARDYRTEYDFDSTERARSSNVHNIYQDKKKYRIAKYRVTYELIDEDSQ